jgi:hypothetical protein
MDSSFERFLADLESSIEWVRSLGLPIDCGRFGDYKRWYAKAVSGSPIDPGDRAFALGLAGIEAGQELDKGRVEGGFALNASGPHGHTEVVRGRPLLCIP